MLHVCRARTSLKLRRSSGRRSRSISHSYAGNHCIGIVNETPPWERRAPLCPRHVTELVNDGYRILVQPCNKRIFTDEEYAAAGAEISSDLSPASVILGIKQVPPENILPEKSYMFFSHTIKAQPQNMPLLDNIIAKRVRLFDYECISTTGADGRRPRRLVAFGRFAGMAGMVDIMQGLGQRLLLQGYGTPFLNCPPTYTHTGLSAVERTIGEVGEQLSRRGLPEGISPLVFLFTGTGNVSKGAQEVFRMLPHRMVDVSELPSLVARVRRGELPRDVLYGAVAEARHMVRRADGGPFDRADYACNPASYKPVFGEVARHASVLANCMYWDARFPKLLTKAEMRRLALGTTDGRAGSDGGNGSGDGSGSGGRSRLLAVADITCDVGGSVEFLDRCTTVQRPFFLYDPVTSAVHDDDITELEPSVAVHEPILMMGLDILPSELPLDASLHFGDAISPFVRAVASAPRAASANDLSHLPPELAMACVASHGQLAERFRYIEGLRRERERSHRMAPAASDAAAVAMPAVALLLQGHLFDAGLINCALDAVEAMGGFFTLVDCFVEPNLKDRRRVSSAVIRVDAATPELLAEIVSALDRLCRLTPGAEATLSPLADAQLEDRQQQRERRLSSCSGAHVAASLATPSEATPASAATSHRVEVSALATPRVLVLGAGMTCGPLVEYLGRGGARRVTVVSSVPGQADAVAGLATDGKGLVMDAGSASDPKLQRLVEEHDVVVSMLPAPMHPAIAALSVARGKDMVTASYVGPEMRALHDAAVAAGVRLVNEVGLDPGMDHMAVMRVVDGIARRGGRVTALTSVCGGLPAPESADNPLLYKFSWSPAGVLRAAANPATFLRDGRVVSVPGDALLAAAEPADHPWGALNLEQLPNRDSLAYADLYGVAGTAETVFRGTLRYAGWSDIMLGLRSLGLYSEEATTAAAVAAAAADGAGGGAGGWGDRQTWAAVFRGLAASRGFDAADPTPFLAAKGVREPERVVTALRWLRVAADDADAALAEGETVGEAMCGLLQQRCAMAPGDRDLVLMHHSVRASFPGGGADETHLSSLMLRGGVNFTAMSRTVGITVAVAAELVLEGEVAATGVMTPVAATLYEPALRRLDAEGIRFTEKVIRHRK